MFRPVMHPICGGKGGHGLLNGVKAVERGRTLPAREDLTSMCSCLERAGASVTEGGGPGWSTPPGRHSSVMGRGGREEVVNGNGGG